MKFTVLSKQNYLLYDTSVDNLFISEYAKNAPGDCLKVYLYALMHVQQGLALDNAHIAKALNLSAEDVDKAWDYWQNQGVIIKTASAEGYDVSFVNIKEAAFGHTKTAAKPAEKKSALLTDKEFSKLLKDIEAVKGGLLEAKEPETIASLINDYGFVKELILFGYEYCAKNGKSTGCSYVEKILKNWKTLGIKTKEDAIRYLEENDRRYSFYRRVLKELGLTRNPSEPEKRLMDGWIDKLGVSLNEVLEACKKTTGISNPNINYLNTVITKAHTKEEDAPEKTAFGETVNAVEASYEKIRNANAEKTAKIRAEIFTMVPELRDISDKLKDSRYKASRYMLAGDGGVSFKKEKEYQKQLLSKQAELLKENGYREDALEPIFSCKICKDTGVTPEGERCGCYIRIFTENNKSVDGKLFR